MAYNYFPETGDMVIDSDNTTFFSSTANNSRGARNTLMHEIGHGIGIDHVESVPSQFLMNPFINTAFDGPQFDDILAIQRGYGDAFEKGNGNDTSANAFDLGTISSGSTVSRGTSTPNSTALIDGAAVDFASIDDESDLDFFKFTVTTASAATLTLIPKGPTYTQAPQTNPPTTQTSFNGAAQSDLTLQLIDTDGTTVLNTANTNGLGGSEIVEFPSLATGTYFARVSGATTDKTQMYRLDVSAVSTVTTTASLDGSNNLVLTDSTGRNDALTIKADTSNSRFVVSDPGATFDTAISGVIGNGTNSITIPFSSISGGAIFVNLVAGNDSLTIDLSLGNFSKTIIYDGGTQTTSDALTLLGGGTFATVAHTLTNNSSGTIDVTGNSQFSYLGLEPVIDNLSATNRGFTFNFGAETITLTDATGANMTIDSDVGGESVTFANPTSSLTINAGSGADTVTINSVDTDGPFNASLTINGDDSTDTVNLNAALNLASGNSVSVTAEFITVGAAITVSGAGTIALAASGSSSGSLTVNAALTSASGAIALSSVSDLTLSATGDIATTSGLVTLTADSDSSGAGVITSAADVNHGSTGSQWSMAADGANTMSGVISGSGNFTKSGAGILALSGTNTFTGTTTVSAGRLNVTGSLVDGTAATDVTVSSGAVLGGTGTISGAISVSSGGTVRPGTSPGILNSGDVTFVSGSTFDVEIGGTTAGNAATNHDQLNVTGTVSLGNATLTTTQFNSFVPTHGNTFTIINNDGSDAVVGTFNGLAEGAVVTSTFLGSTLFVTISYVGGTGNDVVLTARSGRFFDNGAGTSVWQTAANWSGDTLPLSTDNAYIGPTFSVTVSSGSQAANALTSQGGLTVSAGSLALAGTSTLSSTLTLSGGTFGGAGTVSLAGAMTWSGGTLGSGGGTLNANGGMTINGGAKSVGSYIVNASGTTNWSAGNVTGSGTTFRNFGTFNAQADLTWDTYFNNLGTFNKTAGSGTTRFDTFDNNSAGSSVNVSAGTLRMGKGGTHSRPFNASGFGLEFGGDHTFNSGANITASTVQFTNTNDNLNSAISVASTYNVSSSTTLPSGTFNSIASVTFTSASTVTSVGSLTISGGNAVFNPSSSVSVTSVNLSAGKLEGSATVNASGASTWSGGTFGIGVSFSGTGGGTFNSNGGMTISGSGSIDRYTVNLGGTTNWSAGTFSLSGNATTLRNFGTLNVQGDLSFTGGYFNNAGGTLRKTTGSGTATMVSGNFMDNFGTVEAQSGTLRLDNVTPGTASGSSLLLGTWIARANSTIDIGNFAASSLTTNTVFVTLDGANSVFNEINSLATNTSTASFTVSGGRSFTTAGALSNAGSVTVGSSSSLTTAASQNYTQTAGTTTVNGTLTSTGTVQINGGTLKGTGTISGTTSVAGGNVSPGASPGILNTGNISFNSSSTFTVEVNGTTTAGTDYGQLNVTGTVSLGNATLSHSGTVTALGKTIVLINNDGSDAVTGTFNGLAEGATVTINGVSFKLSYVGGTGNDVTLSGDTDVSLDGSNNLIVTDTGGATNDSLVIKSNTSLNRFEISETGSVLQTTISGASGNGTDTLFIPFASVGGTQILVNTDGGNDSLTIDLSLGNFSKTITYDGGDPTTALADSLTLTGGPLGGGSFATVTHTFTSNSAGTIAVTGNSTISYLGLEPVTDNLSATDRVFTFNAGAEAITLVDATGANMRIDSDVGGESVTFANPTSSLTINAGSGADTVTINSVDTDGPFNASLTINGDAGSDTVALNADITFASNNSLDVNLTNDASGGDLDSVTVGTNANLITSGSGSISLQSSGTITTAAGSSLETVNGGITVAANAAATGSGNFVGVTLTGTTLTTSGTGAIAVTGRGVLTGSGGHGVRLQSSAIVQSTASGATAGTVSITGSTQGGTSLVRGVIIASSGTLVTSVSGAISITGSGSTTGTGSNNIGVQMASGADVTSTGAGANAATITINGTGGTGASGGNQGLSMSGSGTTITSINGAIAITGQGGNDAAGSGETGVLLTTDVLVESIGTGTLTITGTAGNGAGSDRGINIDTNSIVRTTGSGDVLLVGTGNVTGGAGETSGFGILLYANGLVTTTGSGNVTLRGIGSTSGGDNDGISIGHLPLASPASVTSTSTGNVTLQGKAGTGSNTYGIKLEATGSTITSSGTGSVTLAADNIVLSTSTTIAAGSNIVTLRPATTSDIATDDNGDTTVLGNASGGDVSGSSNQLDVTDDELNLITAGRIVIGNASSGAVTLAGGIAAANSTTIEVITGSTINDAGAITFTETNVALNAAGGIGTTSSLDIQVTYLALTAATGGINVMHTGNVNLTTVGGVTGVTTTTSGNVSIAATGSITVTQPVSTVVAGTLLLDAQNGDSGDIIVNNTITTASGSLTLRADDDITSNSSGTLTTTSGSVTITADDDASNSGTITYTAAINHGSAGSTWSLADANGSITAVISGSGGFTKNGNGTLTLSGTSINTFTGTTTVNAGTLLVNGSIANGAAATDVTVASGATLGGTGTISGTVSVASGGRVAPGTSPGILNTGSVTLVSGATFVVEIGGTTPGNAITNHDQLNVTGSVSLGNATLSTLRFNSFVPAIGQTFTIIANDGSDAITGTFSGLAEGATVATAFLSTGLTATISYVGGTGNDVVLTVTAVNNITLDGSNNLVFTDVGGSFAPTISNGLVSWWRGEGNALDATGAHPGTFVGTNSYADGKVGQAFSLTGSNYVNVTTDAALLDLTQGTVEMWVKISDLSINSVPLFEVADAGPAFPISDQWALDYRSTGAASGRFQWSLTNNGSLLSAVLTPTSTITDNNFHHFAVVADGVGNIELYVDGVDQTLTINAGTAADAFFGAAVDADNIKIGAIERDTVFAFGTKTIDEVAVYSRGLSAAEITTVYNAGIANASGTNETLTIQSDTTNSRFVISDPSHTLGSSIAGATGNGTNTVMIPFASVSGSQILVNTLTGNDSLTVDLSLGNFSKTITYDGGTQTSSDSLTVTGGATFATVTHTFTSASAGTIAVTGNATISYLGLEPVTDNLSATDRVFTFTGGAETITVTDNVAADGKTMIDSTLGESVYFTNPTGSLTINAGTGDDTVNLDGVDSGFNVSLTVNGDAGTDTVNVKTDLTLAANQNVNIDADNILLPTANDADLSVSGTGTITFTTDMQINLGSGTSLSTVNGGITLAANTAGTTTGNFTGITVNSATLTTSGTGNISLTGRGGLNATIDSRRGIQLLTNAVVESTASGLGANQGTITIAGTGGTGNNGGYIGVHTTGANVRVRSVSGDIQITGQGGSSSSGGTHEGITIWDGTEVQSTGTAKITITGTGGSGTGAGTDRGIDMQTSGKVVSSGSGDILMVGTGNTAGGASETSAFGILVDSGSQVTTTSSGNLTLRGIGGTSGGGNSGVKIGELGAGTVSSTSSGSITIQAKSGTGAGSFGILTEFAGSSITSSGTGSVTLAADNIVLTSGTTISAGSNIVTLRPATTSDIATDDNGDTINIGSTGDVSGASNNLELSDAELDLITAGRIVVGNSSAGAVTFSAAISMTNSNVLEVISGSTINDTGSSTVFTDTSLALNAASGVGTSSTLNVAVSNLAATAAAGGINVTNTGNVNLTTVGGVTGVTATSSNVSIVAASSITVSQPVSVTGSGTVLLDAQGGDSGDIIVNNSVTTASGSLTLRADDDISSNTSGALTTTSGAVALTADDDAASGGTITYTAAINHGSTGSTWSLPDSDGSMTAVISGAGSLTKNGAGRLALSAANTYSGGTTLNAGVVTAQNNLALGTGTVTFTAAATLRSGNLVGSTTRVLGNNIAVNAGITATIDAAAPVPLELNGNITSAATSAIIDKIGPESLALGGDNSGFTGTFRSRSNHLLFHSTTAGSANAAWVVQDSGVLIATRVNGGTIKLGSLAGSSSAILRNDNFVSGTATFEIGALNTSTSFDGVIFDNAGSTTNIVKKGTGTLHLTGTGGNNAYTGTSTVDAGTLIFGGAFGAGGATQGPVTINNGGTAQINRNEALGSNILMTINTGGTFNMNTHPQTVGMLAGTGGTIQNGTALQLFGTSPASSQTWAGSINNTNSGGLAVFVGSATQTLTGTHAYSGNTSVSTGTLVVNGSLPSGSTVTVANTAKLGGTGSVGPVTVQSGGRVRPGTSPGILSSASVSFASGSFFDVEIGGTTAGNAATNHDQLNVTGSVSLGNATLNLSAFNGFVPSGGDKFTILVNDSSDPIPDTFNGLIEGATITNFLGSGLNATISYASSIDGNDGNDIVLTVADLETGVTLDGSNNLVITDTNGGTSNDTLTIKSDTTNSVFIISDPSRTISASIAGATGSGTNTVTIPFGSVAGTQILVNTLAGNDSLTIDLSLGNFTKTITYDGGNPTTGTADSLTVTGGPLGGGSFASVTHTFTSNSAGMIDVTGNSQFGYLGLEPVTDNLSATDRVFTFNVGPEAISLTDSGGADGKMTIDSDVGGESVTFANPSGSLTINAGSSDDTVTINSFDATFNASVTVNGDSGTDNVNINAALTLAANKNFTVNADTISFGSTNSDISTSGAGTVSLTADRSIALESGSSITSVSGAITLNANQQAISSSGNFAGIVLRGAMVSSTSGAISLVGRGGNAGAGNFGVWMVDGSIAESTGTGAGLGTILIQGSAGPGTFLEVGVLIEVTGTRIETTDAPIQINGTAGASSGDVNIGVLIKNAATVKSDGVGANAGTITFNGTGGSGGARYNHGVEINGTSTLVTSIDGDISINGSGGSGSGATHLGFVIWDSAQLTSTGTGNEAANITIIGTGGSGTDEIEGVRIEVNTRVTTVDGDVQVTGTGGTASGSGAYGVNVRSSAKVDSTGTTANAGDITITGTGSNGAAGIRVNSATLGDAAGVGDLTLTADRVELASSAVVRGAGTLTIKPLAASTSIGLGGGSGTLNLDDTELGFLNDGFSSITIGNAAAGTGAVDVDSSTFADNLTIVGGSIAVTELSVGSNSLTLTARTGAITDGDDVGTDVTAGDVAINAGGAIGASGDQLSLAAATLTTNSTLNSANGNQFLNEADSVTIAAGGLNAGTGTINLTGGTFTLGGAERIDNSSKVDVGGATFALGAFSETVNTLTLSSGSITGSTGVLTSTNTIQTQSGSNSAILAGTNGLTQSTSGTTTLSAVNIFTGATTISGGQLNVNGSTASGSAVTVQTGATLGGTGTVFGSVSSQSGGHVAPGTSPGILDSGSVSFASGSFFDVEIGGTVAGDAITNHDQLNVTGTVSLGNATLSATRSFTPSPGNTFVIVNNNLADAVSGTFNGLAEGATITVSGIPFLISYVGGDGNDVVLTANNAGPSVTSIVRANSNPTNAASVGFTVTFSESVTGVGTGDFVVDQTGLTGATITGISGMGTTYTVTVATGTGDGTLSIDFDFDADGGATNGTGGTTNMDFTAGESYTIDKTSPVVSSIVRAGTSPTNAASVGFTVTFSEGVTGVDANDFVIDQSGLTGAMVTSVMGSGTTYTVTVSSGNGSLSIDFDFDNSGGATDLAGNTTIADFTNGAAYAIDKTVPSVTSIVRASGNPTNAAAVNFTVTFNESVTGVGVGDFVIDASGVTGASVASIMGSGATYTVTVNTGSNSGTLSIDFDFDNAGGATDLAGNVTTADFTTGEAYTIDKTAPAITSFVRLTPATSLTNADSLVFRATFSEAVLLVDAADFSVNGTTTATVTNVSMFSSTQFDVTVSGGNLASFNGNVGLNLASGQNITDAVGNALPNGEPATEEVYLLDNTAPTADIVDVTPDPRYTAVGVVTINFSEDVTNFDLTDLSLTRDAGGVNISGLTLVMVTAQQFTIDLATVTNQNGAYVLTLTAAGSGIQDAAGNLLAVNAVDAFSIDINDQPTFTSTPTPNIAENTTAVVTVAVTDPDLPAQTITFTKVGGADAALFSLNSMSGALTFITAPNFEVSTDSGTNNVYEVNVQADDGNGGLTVQNISVTVTDAAESFVVGSAVWPADGLVRIVISGGKLHAFNSSNADVVPPHNPVNVTDIDLDSRAAGNDSVTIDNAGGDPVPVGGLNFNGVGGTNTLIGPNATNSWVLNGTNAGTLTTANASTFSNVANVTGGSGIDNLNLQAGSLSGSITDAAGGGSVTKTTAGTFTLTGASTYTNATSVNAGTLIIDGSITSNVAIASGATLAGTGSVTGTVTANGGGTVDPGATNGGLDVSGLATFNDTPASTLTVTISGNTPGTDSDLLTANGVTIAAGAALNVSVLSVPALGVPHIIVSNTSVGAVSGTFSGKPQGAMFSVGALTGTISYVGGDGNDITITLIGDLDLGDAPDTGVGTGPGNYRTTFADGGPFHVLAGPRLGALRDSEADGQPNATATGDDLAGTDDEDGLFPCQRWCPAAWLRSLLVCRVERRSSTHLSISMATATSKRQNESPRHPAPTSAWGTTRSRLRPLLERSSAPRSLDCDFRPSAVWGRAASRPMAKSKTTSSRSPQRRRLSSSMTTLDRIPATSIKAGRSGSIDSRRCSKGSTPRQWAERCSSTQVSIRKF